MKHNQKSFNGLVEAITSLKHALLIMQIEAIESELLQHEPKLKNMLGNSGVTQDSSNLTIIAEIKKKLNQLKHLKLELERSRRRFQNAGAFPPGKEFFSEAFQ